MKKPAKEKQATPDVYLKKMGEFNEKINSAVKRLDAMSSNTSFELILLDRRLDFIEKNMVKKDDLRNFATKDDLGNFATKDDLNKFATKDDFARLAGAVQKNDFDIQILRANQATLATKGDVKVIIDTIDAFTKKITTHENKALTHDFRINELEPKVEDHEKRLLALES